MSDIRIAQHDADHICDDIYELIEMLEDQKYTNTPADVLIDQIKNDLLPRLVEDVLVLETSEQDS